MEIVLIQIPKLDKIRKYELIFVIYALNLTIQEILTVSEDFEKIVSPGGIRHLACELLYSVALRAKDRLLLKIKDVKAEDSMRQFFEKVSRFAAKTDKRR